MSEPQTARDLILASNQFAFIQDETKGGINVYVGPHKSSLAQTDRPVIYNGRTRKFDKGTLEQATQEFLLAAEGDYVVLENPAIQAGDAPAHPPSGSQQQAKLHFGRKVNMSGPVTFPLWPGQTAQVINGHRLRSNQYLLVRVYNEDEARKNWSQAVMKPAVTDPKLTPGTDPPKPGDPTKDTAMKAVAPVSPPLSIGKLLVIKGTEVSFYIPPTGIEVVPDGHNAFVREAVTLERLEYCSLLDESGGKRIVKGPDVVFPSPTETFVEKHGERKFKAVELNDDMGIYVKVTADYEEGGKTMKTGEELFITGKNQRIYYPREEHAVIKYGDREKHYAIVIPEGEGRYVLNKENGKVEVKRGPLILLPDPRSAVIVRRVLEEKEVNNWFPRNLEAQAYNARLRDILRNSGEQAQERALQENKIAANIPPVRRLAAEGVVGDDFQRSSAYTPPRTLTLDTRFEGAVRIEVWGGYAVHIMRKSGESRVVVGPKTVLLEYDESLAVMMLSTGKPKNADTLWPTPYLRVSHNRVSDIVDIVTRDMVEVKAKLSYRVNFEGSQTEKWFAVENYVKFLCDHMRSILRHAGKQVGIEEFNNNSSTLIRDTILGKSQEGGRAGKVFEENGMRIYDVEVLEITIGDAEISKMLRMEQHNSVRQALEIAGDQRKLEVTRRRSVIDQEIHRVEAETVAQKLVLDKKRVENELELTLAKAEAQARSSEELWKLKMEEQKHENARSEAERGREKADREQELALAQEDQNLKLEMLKAEVAAIVDKAKALGPDVIAALQAFGDKYVAGEAVKALAPLAILGGKSVMDVAKQLLDSTLFHKALPNGNGTTAHAQPALPAGPTAE